MADRPNQHPAESLAQLLVLGIPVKVLEDSLIDGYHGGASCSPLHPRWFGGSHEYADIVQGLRQRLIQLACGWTPAEERGFATVVSPDRSFQVAVSSADANVGKEESPRTKNPKGRATAFAVAKNIAQGVLFVAQTVLNPRKAAPPVGLTTWFLLYHRTKDEIWFELSLPKSIDVDGRPNDWAIRLKFAPINLNAAPAPTPSDSAPTKHEVVVSRR